MRHAEKPSDPKDPNLSDAGFCRARGLATYIPKEFGDPQWLFASAVSKHSARPFETIKPLSMAVGIPIEATYADQDYEALAADLLSEARYAGGYAVIAWHHGHIPSFAHALGARKGDYPDPWDPDTFDLILRFVWSADRHPAVTTITEPCSADR